ncbi:MAG TPA: hypothetical protein VGM51_08740 [Armatimonadota bacterium]
MPIRRPLDTLLLLALAAAPAAAHHGKDFMLVATDDMPLAGHAYASLSTDTIIARDGSRTTEITPGVLISLGDRVSVEPHFHLSAPPGGGYRYEATAGEVRYRIGNLPGSEWRAALSLEGEKPRDSEEHSNAQVRAILARTTPNTLVAVNLIAGKELAPGGERNYGFAVGALTPLPNGDRAGLELVARAPLADGVELMPSYYHSKGPLSVKVGVGAFFGRMKTSGTFHTAWIWRL